MNERQAAYVHAYIRHARSKYVKDARAVLMPEEEIRRHIRREAANEASYIAPTTNAVGTAEVRDAIRQQLDEVTLWQP